MKPERIRNIDRQRSEASHVAEIRECCATNIRKPHLPGCGRPAFKCANKLAFASRDTAMRRAATLSPRYGHMTVYRCTGCKRWHYGHPKTTAEGL